MNASICPNAAELARLLEDRLEGDEQRALSAHLESCPRCQRQVEKLAAGDATWAALAAGLRAPAPTLAPELAAALAAPGSHAFAADPLVAAPSADLPEGFLAPPREAGHLGRLGQYEVIEEIGRGAMGVVLKAFDEQLHRVVAIKVMAPQLAGHATSRLRFTREGHAAAAVCHEHVVTIYSVAEAGGLPYLVMQYVGGQSLEERLAYSGGPLALAEILRIGMQAAAGLAAAHQQGLVHRDIKPANLLLENSVERVKLTDFGLARAIDDARLTQSGVITGTPQYMAPEQARGEPVDGRADLFSLGCVLYELATGRPPFRAGTTLAVLRRICEDEPRGIRELNPEIPDWLAAIIMKLLAKRPADRFATAGELSTLLAQCLAHVQQPDVQPLPIVVAPQVPRPIHAPVASPAAPKGAETAVNHVGARDSRRLIAVLVVVALAPCLLSLLLIGVGIVGYWLTPSHARPATDPILVPRSSNPLPAETTIPAAEVLAELEKLADIAQQELLLAKQRFEAGITPKEQVIEAEIAWLAAQVRYDDAAHERDRVLANLRRIVELREEELKLADERLAALTITHAERLEVERKLTAARLALKAVESSK